MRGILRRETGVVGVEKLKRCTCGVDVKVKEEEGIEKGAEQQKETQGVGAGGKLGETRANWTEKGSVSRNHW